MEIIVAEALLIHVFEVSGKFPVAAVTSQNHCGFGSHIVVTMS
jgi:hypothetical protein